ncbi:hypothetical protein V8G54_006124 [Vigna mungo]|uniref:Uncharacterized protein n=1 Tax=Vigna mungo TaxID=3915 RepID=A0AAQ3P1M2_VIGMU
MNLVVYLHRRISIFGNHKNSSANRHTHPTPPFSHSYAHLLPRVPLHLVNPAPRPEHERPPPPLRHVYPSPCRHSLVPLQLPFQLTPLLPCVAFRIVHTGAASPHRHDLSLHSFGSHELELPPPGSPSHRPLIRGGAVGQRFCAVDDEELPLAWQGGAGKRHGVLRRGHLRKKEPTGRGRIKRLPLKLSGLGMEGENEKVGVGKRFL